MVHNDNVQENKSDVHFKSIRCAI